VVTSVLHSVPRLDPAKSPDIYDDDRDQANTEIEAMIADLRDSHQIEASVEIGPLKERIALELLEYGPIGELMRDPDVREIQVVGVGPIATGQSQGAASTSTSAPWAGCVLGACAGSRLKGWPPQLDAVTARLGRGYR
jgi:hypothetical protein